MCAMAHTKYTPEALLSMPDGDQYELVDGELVERPMGFRSSRIGGSYSAFSGHIAVSISSAGCCPRMLVINASRMIPIRFESRISPSFKRRA